MTVLNELPRAVVVPETVGAATTDSVTPTTMVSRTDIQQTPGADRTNAMEMITDFVPASYVTHDMLHIMGGHQVNWLIDGVPIPNTNIATNLGPQILPRDIDYLSLKAQTLRFVGRNDEAVALMEAMVGNG